MENRLTYKKAGIEDMELLVRTRLEVLRAANGLEPDEELPEVERETRDYLKESLSDGSHAAYLVFDGDCWAGAGGVSFYRVMPTCNNPTGKKAYIMNMYTAPEYRRKGIASGVLDLLVEEAENRNVTFIALEATQMGRPLYEKYGFIPMKAEMKLPQ